METVEQSQVMVYNPEDMKPLPDIDLVKFCKQTREDLGLSKSEIADLLNVHKSNWDHWEAGRVQPNGQAIAKLYLLREKALKAKVIEEFTK